MFKKLLFLGAATLAMTATSTIAADASRARLMIPVQVTLSGADLDSYESPSASGYNLQYVHSSGFGIGYTSTSFTATTSSGSETTFKDTTFVDLSYTIGSEMTAQFVLGSVIGQGPVTGPGFESENTSKSGTAFGINGGYDFGGFEALIGYRSESVTAGWAGGVDNDVSRSLIMAGVGITF